MCLFFFTLRHNALAVLNFKGFLFITFLFVSFFGLSQDAKENVPFALVESVPVYPGCEGVTNMRVCFQEQIQKHLAKHFRYPKLAIKRNLQGTVFVQFTVGKGGYIDNIKTRGPHVVLEEEAKRIISLIPRFKPGVQEGELVRVPFSIPIIFKLQ